MVSNEGIKDTSEEGSIADNLVIVDALSWSFYAEKPVNVHSPIYEIDGR